MISRLACRRTAIVALCSASKRCITSSAVRMQQQQQFGAAANSMRQTTGGFRSFGQPMESIEEGTELDGSPIEQPSTMPASRFVRPYGATAATAGTHSSRYVAGSTSTDKPAINPFPEELSQDYASPTLFAGASEAPLPKEVTDILQADLAPEEVEIKPDGALYLPESRYRRVLGKAFGAGGWCLVPRGAHSLNGGVLSREYALYCGGRFISQARGHAAIQAFSNPAMASEVVRSNALMRVCKDLGLGNELWDPAYCNSWRATYAIRRTDSSGKMRWSKKETQ